MSISNFHDLIDVVLPEKFSQSILEKESIFSKTKYDTYINMSWNIFLPQSFLPTLV